MLISGSPSQYKGLRHYLLVRPICWNVKGYVGGSEPRTPLPLDKGRGRPMDPNISYFCSGVSSERRRVPARGIGGALTRRRYSRSSTLQIARRVELCQKGQDGAVNVTGAVSTMDVGRIAIWLRRKRRKECILSLGLSGLALIASAGGLSLSFALFW